MLDQDAGWAVAPDLFAVAAEEGTALRLLVLPAAVPTHVFDMETNRILLQTKLDGMKKKKKVKTYFIFKFVARRFCHLPMPTPSPRPPC